MTELNWNKKVSYPETTKIFSPMVSDGSDPIEVNKDLCLSIIQTVQSENVQLKDQIQRIQQQIQNLEGMTKYLTSENEALRCHYSQRNRDIQNMIQAIKINLGVEISDINHQMHLLREGNCLIFKNIQGQLKKQKQFDQRIQQLTKKLIATKQETIQKEEKVYFPSQVRLKNKLNNKTLQKLAQERDKKFNSEQTLTKEVNDLVMEINQLQKSNIMGIREERVEKQEIGRQKQNFRGNIISTLRSLHQLKSDIQLQQVTFKQMTQQKQILAQKLKKLQTEAKQKQKQQEKKMSKLTQIISQREAQLISFDQTRKSASQLQIQIMKKRQQKQKLRATLISKQSETKKNTSDHQLAKHKLQEQKSKTIFKLKIETEKVQIQKSKQQKQLGNYLRQEQKNVDDLKNELSELNTDLRHYEQMFTRIENPIKQLQKEQIKQKFNQPRKPLFLKSQ